MVQEDSSVTMDKHMPHRFCISYKACEYCGYFHFLTACSRSTNFNDL